ncbi:hypothetical protein GYA49_03880, partial [Candidatus Beckwithbacteria bacterium]|nr:hypothetical protein [Candidatus Beckwithbacteria bacterium]
MLSSSEEKFIRNNISNYYQVISCNTHLFGEPFLENNFLYYFDGTVITLISPRMAGETTESAINQTIKKILAKHNPQNLIFWGESPTLTIASVSTYHLDKKVLQSYQRELVFKTSDFVASKKYKSYLHKANQEKLTINPAKISYYKAAYTH